LVIVLPLTVSEELELLKTPPPHPKRVELPEMVLLVITQVLAL
jgi:hypothetical protein